MEIPVELSFSNGKSALEFHQNSSGFQWNSTDFFSKLHLLRGNELRKPHQILINGYQDTVKWNIFASPNIRGFASKT